jgi:hypothetical protein
VNSSSVTGHARSRLLAAKDRSRDRFRPEDDLLKGARTHEHESCSLVGGREQETERHRYRHQYTDATCNIIIVRLNSRKSYLVNCAVTMLLIIKLGDITLVSSCGKQRSEWRRMAALAKLWTQQQQTCHSTIASRDFAQRPTLS